MPGTTDLTPINSDQLPKLMGELHPDWSLSNNQKTITREYKFKGFYRTMSFVNAVAWIAQESKHHPDMELGFGRCVVNFTTHDADGLTRNDFDCAKKVDQLL